MIMMTSISLFEKMRNISCKQCLILYMAFNLCFFLFLHNTSMTYMYKYTYSDFCCCQVLTHKINNFKKITYFFSCAIKIKHCEGGKLKMIQFQNYVYLSISNVFLIFNYIKLYVYA